MWATLITYLVSIPLGVAKAVRHGSAFDLWSSALVVVGYAVPGFLFAIVLIVLFAGGSYLDWFPCVAWLPRAPSASARWRVSPITSGTWRCRWVRWWSAVSPA